ncbi:MAG: discoidin domain-containing protein, partial [Clostridia bacterium]|nr:discoidin domain-containing protein [Clostridia bacterium]
TYIHTSWQVTQNNPLRLTFDLGAERKINRISFNCRNNNGMLETPKEFTVEGCLDGSNWFEVATFTDAPRSGNTVTVNFDDTTLRYCRIVISKAHQGNGSYYIVIGEVTFTHATEVLGGKLINPDNNMFTYKGHWYGAQAKSNFGHVYVGKKGATVTFEFEGTRLGILSSNAYGRDYEVTIDKKKVDSIDLKQDSSASYASFISGELASGKHKVTIKCKGIANIDSFVIYP